MKRFLAVASLCLLFSCGKFSKLQKSDDIDLKYRAAMRYYEEKKDYYHAGLLMEELVPLMRGQAEAEKINLYYGYCQYHQGSMSLSAYYFKRFYETFPRSQYAEEAQYMHAVSLYSDSPEPNLDQTNTHEAIDLFQAFIERNPESKYLSDCNKKMDELYNKLEVKSFNHAKLYYKIRQYKASLVALDNLMKDYPSSVYIEEAMFMKVEASYQIAHRSIEIKRLERYKAALQNYQLLVDRFPESKYVKATEYIYDECNKQIAAYKERHHLL